MLWRRRLKMPAYTLKLDMIKELVFAVTPQSMVYLISGYHSCIRAEVVVDCKLERVTVLMVVYKIVALERTIVVWECMFELASMKIRWGTKSLVNTLVNTMVNTMVNMLDLARTVL